MAAPGDMASDEYACSAECGDRVLGALGSRGGGHVVGADGVRKGPSGRVLQQLLGGQR